VSNINENIAYAKSILNKNGVNTDSPEYKDYLKIREICGNNNGYVGILTKIRFVDNIDDMDEISSIFDILKNSKIDVNKLTRMSYSKILDLFYNELGNNDEDEDVELVYKDSQYSYFKVNTYKGILRMGSPTWCLKTKSHWDNYHKKYPDQWVVIDNRYVKTIITPDNNYLDNYKSSKGWVRFGVSIDITNNSYVAFSDNNVTTRHDTNHTFFGILFTILNLSKGIKKSYYQRLPGCEPLDGTKSWLKVINRKMVCSNFGLSETHLDDEDEIYITCSKSYSSACGLILLNPNLVKTFFPISFSNRRVSKKLNFVNLSVKISMNIIEKYAIEHTDTLFSGIQLSVGNITEDDIKNKDNYIGKVGKWLIFDRNSNFYQVVNTENDKGYEVPTYSINQRNYEMSNPMYFYINKSDYSVYNTNKYDSDIYTGEVIDYLRSMNKPEEVIEPEVKRKPIEEPKKKVGGFWNFFKGK
jgi:hypothetical protein